MPTTRSGGNAAAAGDSSQGAADTQNPNPTFAMKIPRFWKENPKLWFAQIEAQFELHRITNERTKYFIILADLDTEILSQVSDIVMNPPQDAYKQIKQRLIEHFSISEEHRIKTLLTNLEIGDKKPSALLREMKNLANGGVTDDFLRTMWLQRLPSQTQAILATSSEPLDNLVKMADKIGDIQVSRISNISEVYSLADVMAQIENIKSAIRNLQKSRSRSRESTPTRNTSAGGICYYHRRFKERARKCRSPCSFVSNSSENIQPGH